MVFSLTIPAFLLSEMARGIAYGLIGAYIIPFIALYIWGTIQDRKQYRKYMEERYGPNWKDKDHQRKVDAEELCKNQKEFEKVREEFY